MRFRRIRDEQAQAARMMEALTDILVYADKCLDHGRSRNAALEKVKRLARDGLGLPVGTPPPGFYSVPVANSCRFQPDDPKDS